MLNFQEQVQKDIDDIFFNTGAKEFVTIHKIAGVRGKKASPAVECNVVIDNELYQERRLSSKAENISSNGLVFFIKESEWIEKFKYIPQVNNSALQFDGQIYQVSAINIDIGILEITLEANRG